MIIGNLISIVSTRYPNTESNFSGTIENFLCDHMCPECLNASVSNKRLKTATATCSDDSVLFFCFRGQLTHSYIQTLSTRFILCVPICGWRWRYNNTGRVHTRHIQINPFIAAAYMCTLYGIRARVWWNINEWAKRVYRRHRAPRWWMCAHFYIHIYVSVLGVCT